MTQIAQNLEKGTLKTTPNSFSLDDKYTVENGLVLMSGIQALVRLPLDQHKADKRAGLNTATLVSGYRGSPVGNVDSMLERSQHLLQEHQVTFVPGVNEDLAATAIFGAQMSHLFPKPKYDGVLGMWYGKGPGVDRSGDIFKHAQNSGIGPNGGVLAIAGDDPSCKSSTVPHGSELALFDANMPILYPGNVEEVLWLGRYGFELSRYSGLWTALKFVTDVADAYSTAIVRDDWQIIKPDFSFDGKPWQATLNPYLLAPVSIQQEREIFEGRLEAAKRFSEANQLNRIVVNPSQARLGIVAAGKTYFDLRQALYALDLDDDALENLGIRILKVNMPFPLADGVIQDFAKGLEEILVIEEKREFIELLIRNCLYNHSERPRIIGKKDEHGHFLVKADGELDADEILKVLHKRLKGIIQDSRLEVSQHKLEANTDGPILLNMAESARTPYFCSGCPHNRSTTVPEGAVVGGGIGCHSMTMFMDRNVTGLTQMGGEGAQWAGASYFSGTDHIFQNIGDGTLFHSGSMAIRQAIASDANITYKLLYNHAVAMTGGQQPESGMGVAAITKALKAEGVTRIVVVTDELTDYNKSDLAEGTEIWTRDRYEEVQISLSQTKGVSLLIYDQGCAANLRRLRKRQQAPDPKLRVLINEAVCEGCGDCGEKSNCMSVLPVETEFGRKTQIHQSSCNKDYSCLEGDCPAFLTIIPDETDLAKRKAAKTSELIIDFAQEEPVYKVPEEAQLYIMGIGGTGVVTVNQIFATAAVLDGKYIHCLDQTGLSQKGGPVVSHIKLFNAPPDSSNKIGTKNADAYIALDILGANTEKNLKHANKESTIAVVSSSKVPTGHSVANTAIRHPDISLLVERIEAHTKAEDNVYLNAINLAENLFGSHMPSNLIVMGAAYQNGLIPVSASSIESAIELNGVAVQANKQAFRVGRQIVLDPSWQHASQEERKGALSILPELNTNAQQLINSLRASGELRRLLEIRIPELIDYQNVSYAKRYIETLTKVLQKEQHTLVGSTRFTEAVARYLFKLMTYKDEYEVARLHLRPEFQTLIPQEFGENASFKYQLHPPMLKKLGLKKKIGLGKSNHWLFSILKQLKWTRNTPLDIFGYDRIRKIERSLIKEYTKDILHLADNLNASNLQDAVNFAELPDMIRGYEDVKLQNVEKYKEAREAWFEGVGWARAA